MNSVGIFNKVKICGLNKIEILYIVYLGVFFWTDIIQPWYHNFKAGATVCIELYKSLLQDTLLIFV